MNATELCRAMIARARKGHPMATDLRDAARRLADVVKTGRGDLDDAWLEARAVWDQSREDARS